MAVVASFTHNGQTLIPPSQEVTFTDTSSGSPTHWLWTFGDGGDFSNLQNPTHTFNGESPDTFIVTLQVWKASSSSAVSMGAISGTARSSHKVMINNSDVPAAEAQFNAWGPNAFNTISSTRRFSGNMIRTFGGETRTEIRAIRCQWAQTPTTNVLKIPTVRVPLHAGDSWYNRYPDGSGGTVVLKRSPPGVFSINDFVTVATAGAAGFGRTVTFSLAGYRGVGSNFMITSTELVNANKDYAQSQDRGWWGSNVQPYDENISSGDEDETSQQLIFGTPPIADFTGSPLSGGNPLEVQFENLTTLAVGLPTTYSWLKKKSGTADPFVEFSTEENPLTSFGK